MPPQRIPSRGSASGLRTRFSPRSRLSHGWITLAPWLNVFLLMVFYILVFSRIVVQPGYVVELPTAPFANGLHPVMTAVVLSMEPAGSGGREEVIFFDDVPFRIHREKQWDRLHQAMNEFLHQRPGVDLTIVADSRVRYGTLVELMTRARQLGVKRINLAHRERLGVSAE